MTFRRKLLAVFALTVFLSVGAVAWLVLAVTRNAFEKTEDQRTAALVTQFQREFDRRGEDVARRVEAIAASDPVSRMATALNGTSDTPRTPPNILIWPSQWQRAHQLDFLEFLDGHGTIISSAQWPAKFGYPETAFESLVGFERAERISETRRIAGLDRVGTLCGARRRASASIRSM